VDAFGKVDFANVDGFNLTKKTTESASSSAPRSFWIGYVTPALHYTMGGMSINTRGQAIQQNGQAYPGLYVAGEAAGGIHGVNRLGGNALSECVVFGRIVGQNIPLVRREKWSERDSVRDEVASKDDTGQQAQDVGSKSLPIITLEELSKHNREGSLWTAIDGRIYDLTEFLEEHP
jgi:succinate dehydrogenase/fumarate reductase flavoprotein subunit